MPKNGSMEGSERLLGRPRLVTSESYVMRYVFRDDDGTITAVYAQPQNFATEEVAPDDPELLTFLSGQGEQDFLRSYLTATDAELSASSRIWSTCWSRRTC